MHISLQEVRNGNLSFFSYSGLHFSFLFALQTVTVVENENGEEEKKMGTGMGSRVTDP